MTFTAGQKLRASELNAVGDDVPFGHAGITAGFILATAANGIYPTLASQTLKNGVTFSSNGLVVPKAGLYEIVVKGYFTGGAGYIGQAAATINTTATPPASTANAAGSAQTWKADSSDYNAWAVVRRVLTANSVIRLWTKAGTGGSTYGSTGYDGAYIEVLYICS